MKLITVVVPCYNSGAYLDKCLNSLLIGDSEIEVIIVNDGSTDNTESIAKNFIEKDPDIFRLISKENGGHGSAINAGLKEAKGLFFKVVDSDDWLEHDAFQQLLKTIRKHQEENTLADLYITNFVYNKLSLGKTFIRSFKKKFKHQTFMTWKTVGRFYGPQVLLMHSLLYNTAKLKESKIKLPEHTFYVDNIFAYQPLPFMKRIFYLDIDLYHYFIGREDQSVNINVFTKRYDQQIDVMKEMVKGYTYDEINKFEKGLRNYMFHALGAIMIITILFTVALDEKERRRDFGNMWQFIKTNDLKLYWKLRLLSSPTLVNYLPWKLRGWIMVMGYKFLRRRLHLG